METVNRYLYITYLTFGLIMAWLWTKLVGMVFGWIGPRTDRILFADFSLSAVLGVALGAGVTLYAWRHDRVHQWTRDVIIELSKVTWPSKDETQRSTYIVIVFSFVIALLLAAFDFIWKFTTDLLL